MTTAPAPPTVVFLHIPKAAGTTLNSILQRQFKPHEIFSTYDERDRTYLNDLVSMQSEQIRRIKLVRGHIPFGVHHFLPGDTVYFTLLRDPVQRVLSYYNFALSEPTMHLYERVRREQIGLLDFVTGDISLQVDNLQTRLLSGVGYSVGFDQCNERMLAQAKENIETMFVVTGLTARFDETLLLLGARLGFRRLHYTSRNVTRIRQQQRDSISEEALRAIRARNSYDIQLFDWVKARFEQEIEEAGFQRRLTLFRLVNRAYSQVVPVAVKTKHNLRSVLGSTQPAHETEHNRP